jgi:hypothetical protein
MEVAFLRQRIELPGPSRLGSPLRWFVRRCGRDALGGDFSHGRWSREIETRWRSLASTICIRRP